ncbi:MAG TPA: MBL fold metallo-hydrolase [Thermomicrobiales bacterium]|nr:MBL fold metallo-hydrolase [Thermomicrobiales bacterium]
MKVTDHGDFLIELTRFPLLTPMSCYFVREDDGLTLIDTTIATSAGAIAAAAERLGLPIARIALTHAHSDHIGALGRLHERFPEAEVLAGSREDMSGSRTRPDTLLEHGDRVGSLEVVHSPGHTPGHLAYLDTRDRSLIAGDAFVTRGGLEVVGTARLLMPFPSWFTWHRPTAVASARVLRALAPSRLAVGHGGVVESPLPGMDRAIATAERAVAKQQA